MFLKKEGRRWEEREEEGHRRGRGEERSLAACTCARVFEEKHISLLLLPPSLFFLPADLHSRWVGLLLRFSLSVSHSACSFPSLLQSAFVSRSRPFSLPFFPASSRAPFLPFSPNGKNSTPNARCSLFTRALPREIARCAQWRARTPGGNGAHLLSALSFLRRLSAGLSRSAIEQRLLSALTQRRCTTIITARLRQ